MQTGRKQLRQRLISERQNLTSNERDEIERRCLAEIQQYLQTREPGILGLYWPIKGEIDCRSLAPALIQQGWTLCVPIINSDSQCLDFALWTPDTPMIVGSWNIPVPEQQTLLIPDHFLVPLVGFDKQNFRLGYGGGYYDRTLAAIDKPVHTIGIGMECGRFESIQPQEWDIPMDKVITEKGIQ
jgi:5-formyltetrahydrofolate cyclo-ligase